MMPRKSPFVITLTEEERKILEQRTSRYTLPYFQVIRARIILLAAEGLQNDEIAPQLNTRREVISKWRKRFFYAVKDRAPRVYPGVNEPGEGTMKAWKSSRRRAASIAYSTMWCG